MNKAKSIVVSSCIMAMALVITLAAYRLAMGVFVFAVIIFSSVGIVSCGVALCKWLEKPEERAEEPIEPPAVYRAVAEADYDYDYESIWKEFSSDGEGAK